MSMRGGRDTSYDHLLNGNKSLAAVTMSSEKHYGSPISGTADVAMRVVGWKRIAQAGIERFRGETDGYSESPYPWEDHMYSLGVICPCCPARR